MFSEYDPSPVQRLAQRRSRKIFGIPITTRGLNTFASGLSAEAPAGSGFLGGLATGFAGALGGAQRYDALTHEQMKDEEERDRRVRQEQREIERLGFERQRVGFEGERLKRQGEESDPYASVISPEASGPLQADQIRGPSGIPRAAFPQYFKDIASNRADKDVPPTFKPFAPRTIKETKLTKVDKEANALQSVTDPKELMSLSMRLDLEASTRAAAWAKYRRITGAKAPSQVE